MNKSVAILSIMLSLLLVACGTYRQRSPLSESDTAAIKLSESAETVSQSLVELARIQAVATPPVRGELPDPNVNGLRDLASLDWSGPIGPAVEEIALTSNYKVRVLGHPPAVPIIVTILAKNVPLGTLLRDMAFQAGNKATVAVYSRNRIIELRYASA